MTDAVPFSATTRSPAGALLDVELTLSSEFGNEKSELELIKTATQQLRLGDWGATEAVLKELADATSSRFRKLLASSGFHIRPALSSADAIPRQSLIFSIRTNSRVPHEDFASCLEDFPATLARATNDEAQARVIRLVLWAAGTGRYTLLKSCIENMSYGYKVKLDSVLYEHGLMLWDPTKGRAARLTEH